MIQIFDWSLFAFPLIFSVVCYNQIWPWRSGVDLWAELVVGEAGELVGLKFGQVNSDAWDASDTLTLCLFNLNLCSNGFHLAEPGQLGLGRWKGGTSGRWGWHHVKYRFDAGDGHNVLPPEDEIALFIRAWHHFPTERFPNGLAVKAGNKGLNKHKMNIESRPYVKITYL